MTYEQILFFTEGPVGRIQLNRPQAMNALGMTLMNELTDALRRLEADTEIRCIVLHGNEKAFAAGADIKDMADEGAIEMYLKEYIPLWDQVYRTRKPIIAAVGGVALGGGCELAMICDIIVASETARFGQPEISLGALPGAGGTQRLTRAVGKSLAMEMILTGRMISAQEAKAAGLVSRVVPLEEYLGEAMKMAQDIATKSPLALRLAKEAVLQSFETSLSSGVQYERILFDMSFASHDNKEGMRAFIEKRRASFEGR